MSENEEPVDVVEPAEVAELPQHVLQAMLPCRGTNADGQPCGRVATPGKPYCASHSDVEPTFRFPWTEAQAKNEVVHYDPKNSGRYAGMDPLPPVKNFEMACEEAHRQARRWLAYYEPEWLKAFDDGTLPPEELRRGPHGLRRPRRPENKAPSPPPIVVKKEPQEDDTDDGWETF